MEIERHGEEIVIVTLAAEPETNNELEKIVVMMIEEHCHVIMDLSKVEFLDSTSLRKLIALDELLARSGRRFILSSLSPGIKEALIHKNPGFEIADDRKKAFQALSTL